VAFDVLTSRLALHQASFFILPFGATHIIRILQSSHSKVQGDMEQSDTSNII
jgi:hypothetical protein